MNASATGVPGPLVFTEHAAVKVKGLIAQAGNESSMLRVYHPGRWVFGISVWFYP